MKLFMGSTLLWSLLLAAQSARSFADFDPSLYNEPDVRGHVIAQITAEHYQDDIYYIWVETDSENRLVSLTYEDETKVDKNLRNLTFTPAELVKGRNLIQVKNWKLVNLQGNFAADLKSGTIDIEYLYYVYSQEPRHAQFQIKLNPDTQQYELYDTAGRVTEIRVYDHKIFGQAVGIESIERKRASKSPKK
jgi:hypothetical protein